MSALDGKIEIEIGLRPCAVSVPDMEKFLKEVNIKFGDDRIYNIPKRKIKALFHCWHPVTGNAIVEYEDGTINEVEPHDIRFVDGLINQFGFWEDGDEKD